MDNKKDIETENINIVDEDIKIVDNIKEEDIETGNINMINKDINNTSKKDNNKEKKSFFLGFLKKKNKEKDIEDLNGEEDVQSTGNIFDEFENDSLLEEVENLKSSKNKDLYYYISTITKVFKIIFVLSIILLSILFGYIYIQNTIYEGESRDNQVLSPFCFILLNNVEHDNLSFCTSISTLNDMYKKDLSNIKKEQILGLEKIIKNIYEINNFTKTKDVVFLKEKTDSKLRVLDILEEFDNLKNKFTGIDKEKIQCSSISIDGEKKVLSMKCASYSAGYEKGIIGVDGTNDRNSALKGTSLTIASSFLNYINLESKIFTIIDKQKVFKQEKVLGEKTGFTSKTPFTLKLKYNLD